MIDRIVWISHFLDLTGVASLEGNGLGPSLDVELGAGLGRDRCLSGAGRVKWTSVSLKRDRIELGLIHASLEWLMSEVNKFMLVRM